MYRFETRVIKETEKKNTGGMVVLKAYGKDRKLDRDKSK